MLLPEILTMAPEDKENFLCSLLRQYGVELYFYPAEGIWKLERATDRFVLAEGFALSSHLAVSHLLASFFLRTPLNSSSVENGQHPKGLLRCEPSPLLGSEEVGSSSLPEDLDPEEIYDAIQKHHVP